MFAFIFDSVGAGEWLVLLAVLLVVMGPKRLPSTARKIGAYYSKFRRAAETFKRQLLEMDTEFDRAVQSAESEMKTDFATDYPSENPAGEMGPIEEISETGEVIEPEKPVETVASATASEGSADGDQPHQES